MADPKVKWAIVQLLSELTKDREVISAIEGLVIDISQRPQVVQATNELLLKSTQEVLVDSKVKSSIQ